MRQKKYVFEDGSPLEFLLLRDKLGLKRYRKQAKRNAEERRILIDLGLKKIQESEKHDYLLIEKKRRRLKVG
ncbi:MAG: hypothetical protein GQ544_04245 [Candidatus Aminicenantes bacterium]|nr:hypothetical protein [Candidatus Aminicenantes bacterium]